MWFMSRLRDRAKQFKLIKTNNGRGAPDQTQGEKDVIKEEIFIGSDPALSMAMVCDVASQGYANLHGEKNRFLTSHIFRGMKGEKRTHSVVTIKDQRRSRDPVPKTSCCVFPVFFIVASNETSLFLLSTFYPVST